MCKLMFVAWELTLLLAISFKSENSEDTFASFMAANLIGGVIFLSLMSIAKLGGA